MHTCCCDYAGLTEQDHVDAKIADAVMEISRDFRPLAQHLVERYYTTRANYIAAMEQQAAQDRAEVLVASSDAPADWRLGRLRNAAMCETKAKLERTVELAKS